LSGTSLKAALDLDWDDLEARQQALAMVLAALDAVESWVAAQHATAQIPAVQASLACARPVQTQDVAPTASGRPHLRRAVARERRIAVEDAEMRHGRKSHRVRVDGYKRHVVHDLDSGGVRAVGLTPANAPEASVTDVLSADLAAQHVTVAEWHL